MNIHLARIGLLASTVMIYAAAPPVAAADVAGRIKAVKGAVAVVREGRNTPAEAGMAVEVADRVVTGVDGSVGIAMRDNTLLSAGPNSTLELDKFAFDTTTHAGALDVSLKRGKLAVISGKIAKANPDAVRVSTPSVTLGVRGTEFIVETGLQDDSGAGGGQ